MKNCPDVCNVTFTVTAAAVAISNCLDADDTLFLSQILVQLGETLGTIALTKERCCERLDSDIDDDNGRCGSCG